jgi:archaellum component FlaC
MAEPENLTLQLLREMRDENRQRFNRIDEKLDRVGADLRDLKIRMTNVEEGLAGVNRRIDRIDERLERVERRLELTDETTQP